MCFVTFLCRLLTWTRGGGAAVALQTPVPEQRR